MSDVTRFPNTWKQRHKNLLGKHSVPCMVSARWLRFVPESSAFESGEDFITVDVMTGFPGKTDVRKLCQLMILREDLNEVLRKVKTVKRD